MDKSSSSEEVVFENNFSDTEEEPGPKKHADKQTESDYSVVSSYKNVNVSDFFSDLLKPSQSVEVSDIEVIDDCAKELEEQFEDTEMPLKVEQGLTNEAYPEKFDERAMLPQPKEKKPGQQPDHVIKQFFEKVWWNCIILYYVRTKMS